MKRRAFLRLAGGGVVVAAAGVAALGMYEGRMPASAVTPWQSAADEADLRRWVLAHALLAPNPHNLQPWMADLSREGEILLSLDPGRLLPATDPFSRQIMMGAGAFLELLALAAAERGVDARIELFPEGEPGPLIDRRPFARVRLDKAQAMAPSPLFAAILRRRTERGAYDPARPLRADALRALQEVVAPLQVAFGTTVGDPARHAQVREIVSDAWRIEMSTERTFMESMQLMRIGAAEVAAARDGISMIDPPLVAAAKLGLFDRRHYPGADAMAIRAQFTRFDALTASTPAYLWIITNGNGRRQQIEAGRAYARLNLEGTRLGLVMHPNEQALQEYPEMKDNYRDIHSLLGCDPQVRTVQMLARLGHLPDGAAPAGPAPRRGLGALIQG